jgi:hypothetical protein
MPFINYTVTINTFQGKRAGANVTGPVQVGTKNTGQDVRTVSPKPMILNQDCEPSTFTVASGIPHYQSAQPLNEWTIAVPVWDDEYGLSVLPYPAK